MLYIHQCLYFDKGNMGYFRILLSFSFRLKFGIVNIRYIHLLFNCTDHKLRCKLKYPKTPHLVTYALLLGVFLCHCGYVIYICLILLYAQSHKLEEKAYFSVVWLFHILSLEIQMIFMSICVLLLKCEWHPFIQDNIILYRLLEYY